MQYVMHNIIKKLPWWLLGIYITMALFSYHPADPCVNVISSQEVKNIGGHLGAYIADILLQSIGLVSSILVLFIFFHRREQKLYLKLTAIILLLLSFSSLLTFMPVHNTWPFPSYGGASGIILNDLLTPYIGAIGFIFLSVAISVISFSYLFYYQFNFDWLKELKLPKIKKCEEKIKNKICEKSQE